MQCPLPFRYSFLILLSIYTSTAMASEPSEPVHTITKDNLYVIDKRTRLIWVRCVEGMRWDGLICSGEPELFTHPQAAALATARRNADGLAWRLPRAAELRRLVDKNPKSPGLNPILFPGAPSDWHWSGSASIETKPVNAYDYDKISQGSTEKTADRMVFLNSWAVHLETGEARSDMPKTNRLPVRFVLSIDN